MSETVTIEETIERLKLFGRTGAWTGFREDILALVNHISSLEKEREELRERVKELEVYEEIEMIGPHPGLPTVGGALRERDTAQAEVENARYQLDWANERIRDLENDIRSHKRVCPMFR
jgi:hypothetical protein